MGGTNCPLRKHDRCKWCMAAEKCASVEVPQRLLLPFWDLVVELFRDYCILLVFMLVSSPLCTLHRQVYHNDY